MTQHVTVELTWPQIALVREVVNDFLQDNPETIRGAREIGLARRALGSIFAAEGDWYEEHPGQPIERKPIALLLERNP